MLGSATECCAARFELARQSNIITGRPSRLGNRKDPAMTLTRYRNICLGLAMMTGIASAAAAELNDYPTDARAEYVFACMKTNGDTQVALRQCSCSIDVIASILPYERYVSAQTVLSLSQVPGRFGTLFQTPEPAKLAVNDLRRAQAEAEIRCF